MDTELRRLLQKATRNARALLEREYGEQLEGIYDIAAGRPLDDAPGEHLDPTQRLIRSKLVALMSHRGGEQSATNEAVGSYVREAAFTTLNRFAALKMLEARSLVQECVSRGLESSGFREFTGLAPGIAHNPDLSYRLYIESLCDEIAQEVGVLFDRRDPASLLWPRRTALLELLEILNAQELSPAWREDETIGWIYQYFNSEDERRKMRDESSAPRNSRELAVRNQFFTPKYVVAFLTDNTLGRIWYEMMKGQTNLADLDYLVRREHEVFLDSGERPPTEDESKEENITYVPHREKIDPRELLVLDPACGSGHFLLYAFDLLLKIYEEAWNDPTAKRHTKSRTTLRDDYPDFEVLRRDLPGLILHNNLYGIDIDPRAAQIASLALWMRAQRAWQEFGLKRDQRPLIERVNIVVAEPMPGDYQLLKEFARSLQPPLLGKLFEEIVKAMEWAGEMGSLLRVDEALRKQIADARQQFVSGPRIKIQTTLPGFAPRPHQESLDLSGIDDVDFFEMAEDLILSELRRFAESASGAPGLRRRLFAKDAARGIAFIDVILKRFHVVLMNPPFGAGSTPAKGILEKSYPRTKNDIYAAFVERGIQLLRERGMLGAITSRTGFFLSSFQRWREEILLKEAPPTVFADLGYGVLDSAMVEVAAYCLEKAS